MKEYTRYLCQINETTFCQYSDFVSFLLQCGAWVLHSMDFYSLIDDDSYEERRKPRKKKLKKKQK